MDLLNTVLFSLFIWSHPWQKHVLCVLGKSPKAFHIWDLARPSNYNPRKGLEYHQLLNSIDPQPSKKHWYTCILGTIDIAIHIIYWVPISYLQPYMNGIFGTLGYNSSFELFDASGLVFGCADRTCSCWCRMETPTVGEQAGFLSSRMIYRLVIQRSYGKSPFWIGKSS